MLLLLDSKSIDEPGVILLALELIWTGKSPKKKLIWIGDLDSS
jgi:hypothetical protein